MEVSGHLDTPVTLHSGVRDRCIHRTEGWMGPSAGLNAVENKKCVQNFTLKF